MASEAFREARAECEPRWEQDSGLAALCVIAKHYDILTTPMTLARQLVLAAPANPNDLQRAGLLLNLKSRQVTGVTQRRLARLPLPAIACLADGTFAVLGGGDGHYRLVDPLTLEHRSFSGPELLAACQGNLMLVQRHKDTAHTSQGDDDHGASDQGRSGQGSFGLSWFLPSLWRYRRAIGHVMVASLFLQLFALITPLFFQVVIDKVLAHRSYDTLVVLVVGLLAIGLFDVVLQFLRTYVLSHTSNRIDVELGKRLFRHLLSLPLDYFETRAAGQTIARMRELETIRGFLTGQGLFSGLDLLFTLVFILVLFLYSSTLAWVVVASIPFYIVIAIVIRPFLRARIDDMFNRGAYSQQLLVESVVGMQTLKAAAIEPVIAAQWEERLAGYVRASFATTMLSAVGQNAIQYVSKAATAAILFFGAQAVIDGQLTVGALVAFNMIANQVAQPILRLSQLWQDFQQVQISIARLGDILNAAPEPKPKVEIAMPRPQGEIAFQSVDFRYSPQGPRILKGVDLHIKPGEVIGIVGPSGSGKSTLAKLVQRFHLPDSGQVLMDGLDIAQADPAWLRGNIGVVLQENLLFNRSIHDNIALANPAMSREAVIGLARLAGAEEFIAQLPQGYDTLIEERGANLSGGQRQRLAIARALATDPPILILDEATSALDYESERLIMDNMDEIVRGRTVIIIAHRLATVRRCDRIVAMKDGRIVESGSHEQLLTQKHGVYARLWQLQMGHSDDPARSHTL